ncbi:hypothetical protein [Providencia sp. JUb39]|uniref:hypothetical protein n=1 Tax=Providencia sp. JUb39 TaxID=2724165 RepID=UPI00164DDD00|nr:hypothetical protein [Providencia sp. JUb39]MBC5789202.1 hypothetical protein [Providencia sp. JUb39]
MNIVRFVIGIITMTISAWGNGEEFLGSVPPTESHYESSQTGWFLVNATLFNAPCGLTVGKTLTLTHCGAGVAFSENKHGAKTPAILLVVDMLTGEETVRYPVALIDGNNPVQLPSVIESAHPLRLEVSYE